MEIEPGIFWRRNISSPDPAIAFEINSTTLLPNPSKESGLPFATNNLKGGVAFCDLQNRGIFDVVWTGYKAGIYAHSTNDSRTFSKKAFAISDHTYDVICQDFDNDGFLDLLISSWYYADDVLLLVLNAGFPSERKELYMLKPTRRLDVEDINNDGVLDLAMTTTDEMILLMKGTSTSKKSLFVRVVRESMTTPGVLVNQINAIVRLFDLTGKLMAMRIINSASGAGGQTPSRAHFGIPTRPNLGLIVEVQLPDGGYLQRRVCGWKYDDVDSFTFTVNINQGPFSSPLAGCNSDGDVEPVFAEIEKDQTYIFEKLEGADKSSSKILQSPQFGVLRKINGSIHYTPVFGFAGTDQFAINFCVKFKRSPFSEAFFLCSKLVVAITVLGNDTRNEIVQDPETGSPVISIESFRPTAEIAGMTFDTLAPSHTLTSHYEIGTADCDGGNDDSLFTSRKVSSTFLRFIDGDNELAFSVGGGSYNLFEEPTRPPDSAATMRLLVGTEFNVGLNFLLGKDVPTQTQFGNVTFAMEPYSNKWSIGFNGAPFAEHDDVCVLEIQVQDTIPWLESNVVEDDGFIELTLTNSEVQVSARTPNFAIVDGEEGFLDVDVVDEQEGLVQFSFPCFVDSLDVDPSFDVLLLSDRSCAGNEEGEDDGGNDNTIVIVLATIVPIVVVVVTVILIILFAIILFIVAKKKATALKKIMASSQENETL
eukprot:TRINITY_DN2111_c0_g1_i3.p1 TRINITY_DN2111_c0_g1~~TRINITY_DN2111_c0_g1_i3.p1  ORF type:complete len:707 (-),score=148.92 TRINITY_DN2111_c0_g1_i3:164-2284(-)